MSKPIIFDTGALIALFNKSEAAVATQIQSHLDKQPHSARFVYEPNLVELFYLLVKRDRMMAPKDVKTNLDHFAVEVCPVPNEVSAKINGAYMTITYKAVFDYADFYMCAAAASRFPSSEILTVDRDDLPLALSTALGFFASEGKSTVQLIPFKA